MRQTRFGELIEGEAEAEENLREVGDGSWPRKAQPAKRFMAGVHRQGPGRTTCTLHFLILVLLACRRLRGRHQQRRLTARTPMILSTPALVDSRDWVGEAHSLQQELLDAQDALDQQQNVAMAHERALLAAVIAGADASLSDVDDVLEESSGSDSDLPDRLADLMLCPRLPATANGTSMLRTWGADRSVLLRAFLVMVHPSGFGGPSARGSRRCIARALGLSSLNFRSFLLTWEHGGFMQGAAVINLSATESEVSALLEYIVSHRPGAGSIMLAFLLGWMQSVGLRRLFSAADLTLPRALPWHTKQGFERVSKLQWRKAGHREYTAQSQVKYMVLNIA